MAGVVKLLFILSGYLQTFRIIFIELPTFSQLILCLQGDRMSLSYLPKITAKKAFNMKCNTNKVNNLSFFTLYSIVFLLFQL